MQTIEVTYTNLQRLFEKIDADLEILKGFKPDTTAGARWKHERAVDLGQGFMVVCALIIGIEGTVQGHRLGDTERKKVAYTNLQELFEKIETDHDTLAGFKPTTAASARWKHERLVELSQGLEVVGVLILGIEG